MSSGSKQYSASIAFTLALFSHLVNHVNIRLQAELEEADIQVPPLHTDATGESALHEHFLVFFVFAAKACTAERKAFDVIALYENFIGLSYLFLGCF